MSIPGCANPAGSGEGVLYVTSNCMVNIQASAPLREHIGVSEPSVNYTHVVLNGLLTWAFAK